MRERINELRNLRKGQITKYFLAVDSREVLLWNLESCRMTKLFAHCELSWHMDSLKKNFRVVFKLLSFYPTYHFTALTSRKHSLLNIQLLGYISQKGYIYGDFLYIYTYIHIYIYIMLWYKAYWNWHTSGKNYIWLRIFDYSTL